MIFLPAKSIQQGATTFSLHCVRERRGGRGFTLVELLVGVTLSGTILLGVLSSYLFLSRQLVRLTNQQSLESEARRALGYFTIDVQKSVGIDTSAALSASRVSLIVPTLTGTDTVTYYYNNAAASASVTVSGSNLTMPATSLTRCVYDGTSVSTLTLLRTITDNNSGTANDLTIRYFDIAGTEYTSYVNYLPGIKQVSMEFSSQTGVANSGTLTPILETASSRLILRNRSLLQ